MSQTIQASYLTSTAIAAFYTPTPTNIGAPTITATRTPNSSELTATSIALTTTPTGGPQRTATSLPMLSPTVTQTSVSVRHPQAEQKNGWRYWIIFVIVFVIFLFLARMLYAGLKKK